MKRDRFGAFLGFGFGAHLMVATGAMLFAPSDLLKLVQSLRADQRAQLMGRLDIGVEAPPRPTPTPPPQPSVVEAPPIAPSPPAPQLMKPPAPEPPPTAPLREALESPTRRLFQAAAAAVAEAGKVLTREDEAGGDTIASGNSSDPTYGLVAGDGTGNVPTRNPKARIGGKRGGRGDGAADVAAIEPDLTRGAHPPSIITDECDFPPEADIAGIDHAVVTVVVTVKPDGHAGGITVIGDPGHGFGRAAMACARRLSYITARDRHGTFLQADTNPFNIRFTR